jgi:hypothetical protein
VNDEEAKKILRLWRPGPAGAEDPQVAAALALARHDQELSQWLEQHAARQAALAEKFRQIPVPAGLKEQIISEQAANERMRRTRQKKVFALLAVIVVCAGFAVAQFWQPAAKGDPLALFRSQMTGTAMRGYGMDFLTNNPVSVRNFLAGKKCPADYVLPAALESAAVAGCAVENWQGKKVSMICFRTGRALPPDQTSDLWLFVAERGSVGREPPPGSPQLLAEGRLVTATWTQGDKIYLLATEGDEALIRKFL